MFKRVFQLFKIARKLSTSGAVETINEMYTLPLPVNLFFNPVWLARAFQIDGKN